MKKHGYVEGSENVYADLGIADPQQARAKADLAHQIVDIIETRKLTQVQAGRLLGVDQPKVFALMRGRLTDFSIERLFRFLLGWAMTYILPSPLDRTPAVKKPTLAVRTHGLVTAAAASRR